MTSLVEQILRAAGDMPDPAAHARYLAKLTTREQEARLEALQRDGTRNPVPLVRFWQFQPKLLLQ